MTMRTPDLRAALEHVASQVALSRHERGRLQRASGTLLRATGLRAEVGEICLLTDPHSPGAHQAEVVGFDGEALLLSPMGSLQGLSTSTQVQGTHGRHEVAVGDFLLGRVVDGMGLQALDGGPSWPVRAPRLGVMAPAPQAMSRRVVNEPLELGVKVIDGLLTCGEGQRVGIFAPAGCGKSTLLSMLCRHAHADVVVLALVGERGREVLDFIHEAIGPQALKRSVLVVATSDRPAGERLKAAFVATTYAEHFAAQGHKVLLMVDSVTRLARAAREIGLAAGEPPTRRGYPPSAFGILPPLFERAGKLASGSITAFYTVLEETDDGNDPVSEEVRSLLDGHFVLSRELAGKGHFPAIDVLGSASRLFGRLVQPPHLRSAQALREMLARYREVELLLRVGEYRSGSDPLADKAIERKADMESFLRQTVQEFCPLGRTLAELERLTC
jgi:type III secretion protein N (ATPase)